MRRSSAPLVAIVGVFAAGGLLFGFRGGGPMTTLLPVAAVLGVLIVAFRGKRDRILPELEWGRAPSAAVAAPVVPTAGRPTRAESPATGLPPGVAITAAPRLASSPRRLAAALGRAEACKLVFDPWFGVGIGFCVLVVGLFGWAWAPDDINRPWSFVFANLPVMAHPMAGMAVVAVHRAVTRARRDGAAELFDSCPLPPVTRTAGHLLTAWVPAAVLAVLCAAYVLVTAVRTGLVYGPVGGPAFADVAAALALGAGAVALGVALGRWAPWRLVPIVAVAALVFPIVGLGNIGAPHWSNARQVSTWPRYPSHDLLFTVRPVWWHLAWLVALVAVVAVLAIARHGSRRTLAVLGVAAVAAAGAGIAQTRPISPAGAARLASLVAEPERHQSCLSVRRVSVCAYRGYGAYAGAMIAEVAPVMAATPEAVPPVVHRQVFNGELADLGPEVGRALGGRGVGGGDAVPLGFEVTAPTRTAARMTTAFAAVGIPVRPRAGDLPTVVAGQSRGVLALWLAARGLGPEDARTLARAYVPDPNSSPGDEPPTALERGMAWPEPCGDVGPAPVAWAPEDLAAAQSILALPEADVRRVVHARWAEFTDASTTTDVLLAAVGLGPVGPVTPVKAAPFTCNW